MDSVDVLIKGIPMPILNMFRGFCTINNKSESEGVIDLMIEYVDRNTGGKNENLKNLVKEYRK
jgi:hypothetical protein